MNELTENPLSPELKEKDSRGNIPASDIDLLTATKNLTDRHGGF
jgi:hypothetical protein